MAFEASVVAFFAIVVFLVVGYFQRGVVAARVTRLSEQLVRSKPTVAVVGLLPEKLSEAVSGDIDRIQIVVTVFSVLPTLIVLFGGRPVFTVGMLAAYIAVGAIMAFQPASRKSLDKFRAATGRLKFLRAVRHLPIDSDRSLLSFGLLVLLLVLVIGADASGIAGEPKGSPSPSVHADLNSQSWH